MRDFVLKTSQNVKLCALHENDCIPFLKFKKIKLLLCKPTAYKLKGGNFAVNSLRGSAIARICFWLCGHQNSENIANTM